MNRTLEQIAQAIFKAWFVDFEPVRAKAAGAPSFPGMPQDAFQSLPASFADSEVGLVPRGWHARRLAEIAELTMGQSPSSDFYNKNGDGLPFHQGVSFFGTRFPVHDVFCTVRNRLAAKGDILFSVRAPVGRINIADRPLVLGRGLAGLRHRQGFQSFLLYSLKHQFAREDSIGDGTIFKAVTKGDMESIRVIDPPDSVVQAFERSVSSLDALIASNECEASVLADARDSTLRALF